MKTVRYSHTFLKHAPFIVNEELLRFYWRLGRGIAQLHFDAEWGSGFYEALSKDLKEAFPDSKGFAVSNLKYMRRYYELFPDSPIRPQVEGEIGDAAIHPQVKGEIMPRVGGEQIFMIPWNHIILCSHTSVVDPRFVHP